MRVGVCKKLEETMHLHVRHLSKTPLLIYYADAEQSALEIRTSFGFFFFFSSW